MNSEKSPKRLFTLRPQKSYNNKDVETRSQTNFDTGKITQVDFILKNYLCKREKKVNHIGKEDPRELKENLTGAILNH